MATIPDTLGPQMQSLLDCANGALIDGGRPASKRFLNPGLSVPSDDCCESGGQLWVRVLQQFPSRTFPALDTTSGCHPLFYVAQLGVGTLRCAHTVDDHLEFPTECEMTGDALGMLADKALLETAIRCCWQPTTPYQKVLLTGWTPVENEGGCVGGEWLISVAIGACPCPEEDAPGPVEVEC